jgi:hypothetical protein
MTNELLNTYRTLLDKVKIQEPNEVELLALAGIPSHPQFSF